MGFRKSLQWLVFALLLSACIGVQPAIATTSPTETSLPAVTAAATATSAPTVTPTVTATAAPTVTATATSMPDPTVTSIPQVAFDKLAVLAIDNRVGGWLVTFKLSGAAGALRLTLGGSTFNCVVDKQYPDRLFCQGLSRPPYDTQMPLVFIDPQSGAELYRSTLIIPTALLVAPTPAGWSQTSCDQRGKGVSCETECRIAPDGNPCIVATCTDLCGPYFSVHTCPDMSLDFRSCTPEQWAQLKAQYQIP
jgi:hypothetical protein